VFLLFVQHTVIIKGTQVYDAEHGGWKELSMLDIGQSACHSAHTDTPSCERTAVDTMADLMWLVLPCCCGV